MVGAKSCCKTDDGHVAWVEQAFRENADVIEGPCIEMLAVKNVKTVGEWW
jgi:hypothetical protein